ncbi:hypothetical protein LX81_03030 [Palleronia aestuarii]|uniref:Uncharacterized protein n=1 Tax=Palleronia aestuarii TaxID=568105 RepID=A0A2W7N2H7_9RHOB|nr:hypothetical protein [Palleronia aestuarii]PZX14231.1 hypothetical protein LX81_03030 [Palleronia aestuarii]
MKSAAIHSPSLDRIIRGELIARHDDGTATIRFAGSLVRRGREITIAEMMGAAVS